MDTFDNNFHHIAVILLNDSLFILTLMPNDIAMKMCILLKCPKTLTVLCTRWKRVLIWATFLGAIYQPMSQTKH